MSRIIFRPWQVWTDPVTDPRAPHQFKSGWDETKDLLRTEVERVSGRDPVVVVQVDTEASSIRQDGFMRADRKVRSEGVIVSFESSYGPLRYACDNFRVNYNWRGLQGWQANVRAIALALGDLRRIDRYGIGRRGEQYVGFNALPPGRPMGAAMTADEAMRLLEAEAQLSPGVISKHRGDHSFDAHVSVAYRRASKRHHPDAGGDATMFVRLTQARDLLTGART